MKGNPKPAVVDENPNAKARVEYVGLRRAQVVYRPPSGARYRFSSGRRVQHVRGEADILFFDRHAQFEVTRVTRL